MASAPAAATAAAQVGGRLLLARRFQLLPPLQFVRFAATNNSQETPTTPPPSLNVRNHIKQARTRQSGQWSGSHANGSVPKPRPVEASPRPAAVAAVSSSSSSSSPAAAAAAAVPRRNPPVAGQVAALLSRSSASPSPPAVVPSTTTTSTDNDSVAATKSRQSTHPTRKTRNLNLCPEMERIVLEMNNAAKNADLEHGWRLYRTVIDSKLQTPLFFFGQIVYLIGARGDIARATIVREEMKALGLSPNEPIYSTLITLYSKENDFETSMKVSFFRSLFV